MRFSSKEENSEMDNQTLKEIKEDEKMPLKWSENKKKKKTSQGEQRIKGKDERVKSAGCSTRGKLKLGCRKRPKSTESFWSDTEQVKFRAEMKKNQKEMFEVKESCCRGGFRCECASFLDLNPNCSGLCALNEQLCACDHETNRWMTYEPRNVDTQRRRCRSNPNFSHQFFEKEKKLHKMKRSLRLIGLELSDFGVSSKKEIEITPRCRNNHKPSGLSTKLTGRRFSLESLREAITKAWLDDRLDESHRKLVSQAAYEEWYFKKEKELQKKLGEERHRKAEAQEKLRKELERKKAKAEEEFRKWIQRKRIKKKEKENSVKTSEEFGRIRKTREDSEAAFLKWKKEKDKELEKKILEKKKEKEQQMVSEREKSEKRKIAEKAFQQWKFKLEENEKLEEEKRQKLKRQQEELNKRRKQGVGQISFQEWKKSKDEEINWRLKQFREMTKLEREERQARLEEKMYEAEQAFEDWLEKLDVRKQKQFCDSFQKTPWIPV